MKTRGSSSAAERGPKLPEPRSEVGGDESASPLHYLIWSNAHRAWWRAGGDGFTTALHEAGFYRRAEAIVLCVDALVGWPQDEPLPAIPVPAVDAHAIFASALGRRAANVGRMFQKIVGGQT